MVNAMGSLSAVVLPVVDMIRFPLALSPLLVADNYSVFLQQSIFFVISGNCVSVINVGYEDHGN